MQGLVTAQPALVRKSSVLMDGYETARCIRELADEKSVILAALSGWGRSEDRKRGLEAGFDRYYVKPIDVPDIEEVLTLGDRG